MLKAFVSRLLGDDAAPVVAEPSPPAPVTGRRNPGDRGGRLRRER